MNIELVITRECNRVCRWCEQGVGLLDWSDSRMPLRKVDSFIRQVQRLGITCAKLSVAGGEPMMHPELSQICLRLRSLRRSGNVKRLLLLTNGDCGTDKMPRGVRPKVSADKSHHMPWFVSPWDLGIRGRNGSRLCRISRGCGVAYDVHGWARCIVAVPLGRVLGEEVHSSVPPIRPLESICRHCLYSIPVMVRLGINWLVASGAIPYPSKTFAKGLSLKQRPLQQGEANLAEYAGRCAMENSLRPRAQIELLGKTAEKLAQLP